MNLLQKYCDSAKTVFCEHVYKNGKNNYPENGKRNDVPSDTVTLCMHNDEDCARQKTWRDLVRISPASSSNEVVFAPEIPEP